MSTHRTNAAEAVSVSLVVPAFNEEARLERGLATAIGYLARQLVRSELIVADDGSSDGTAAAAESAFARARPLPDAPGLAPVSCRVLRLPHRGKGAALRSGVLVSSARDVVIFSDADFSAPIEEGPKLWGPILRGECDVAVGSRAAPGARILVHQSRGRELAGRAFNSAVRLLTGLHVLDTQCGFKAYRASLARAAFAASRIDGFSFDVEVLYLCRRLGARIAEVPVRWSHCEGSRVRPLRDGLGMLIDVAWIRAQDARGRYGAALRRGRRWRESSGPRAQGGLGGPVPSGRAVTELP